MHRHRPAWILNMNWVGEGTTGKHAPRREDMVVLAWLMYITLHTRIYTQAVYHRSGWVFVYLWYAFWVRRLSPRWNGTQSVSQSFLHEKMSKKMTIFTKNDTSRMDGLGDKYRTRTVPVASRAVQSVLEVERLQVNHTHLTHRIYKPTTDRLRRSELCSEFCSSESTNPMKTSNPAVQ